MLGQGFFEALKLFGTSGFWFEGEVFTLFYIFFWIAMATTTIATIVQWSQNYHYTILDLVKDTIWAFPVSLLINLSTIFLITFVWIQFNLAGIVMVGWIASMLILAFHFCNENATTLTIAFVKYSNRNSNRKDKLRKYSEQYETIKEISYK